MTASSALSNYKDVPEADWDIHVGAAFVLYYLFPNITLIPGNGTCTMVKMYPDPDNPGRSTSRIMVYLSQAHLDAAEAAKADGTATEISSETVYEEGNRLPSVEGTMEIFTSTIEYEDYVMGELQQRSAESGQLKYVMFGRNEPALHHFHSTFSEVLGTSPLERIE